MRQLAIVAIGLAIAAGCNRATTPPPSGTGSVNPPPVKQVVAAVAKESPIAPEVVPLTPPTIQEAADDQADSSPPAGNAIEKKPEHAAPERIALLMPGGPLIVDVRITLNGRSHSTVFDELVKKVLEAADTDKDGRPTWKELAANEKYLSTVQPNGVSIGARQLKMLIERYDENRDGRIQSGEAASWIGRDAGMSATAFSLRSNRSFASNPRANSRVWQLLDSDRDGELSTEEAGQAAAKLMSLDADDDRIVAPVELATLREQLDVDRPQYTGLTRDAERYAALHLDPLFNVDRLEYLLSDLYSPRQTLGPGSFSELAGLYNEVDANSDDWLEQSELATLLTIKPHLEIAVAFYEPEPPPQPQPAKAAEDSEESTDKPADATPKREDEAEQPAAIAEARADTADKPLDDVDTPSEPKAAEPAEVAQQPAAQVEILHQVPEIAVVARPSPDRVVLKLGSSLLILSAHNLTAPPTASAAYQDANRNQIRLMVHDQYDALFEELDMNSDGRLGEREIAESSHRLQNRDTDGNGRLTNAELPYSMIAAFLRGERANEASFYVPSSAVQQAAASEAPKWFDHADFNGDGDVSRREFLGSLEQFAQLDSDRDGYINADEAVKFKAD